MHGIAAILNVSPLGFKLMTFLVVLLVLWIPIMLSLRQYSKSVQTDMDNRVKAAFDQLRYERELAEWKALAAQSDGKPSAPPPRPPDWIST